MVTTHGLIDVTLVNDSYNDAETSERANRISNVIESVLKDAYKLAEVIIKDNIPLLNAIKDELIDKTTLTKEDLFKIRDNLIIKKN